MAVAIFLWLGAVKSWDPADGGDPGPGIPRIDIRKCDSVRDMEIHYVDRHVKKLQELHIRHNLKVFYFNACVFFLCWLIAVSNCILFQVKDP